MQIGIVGLPGAGKTTIFSTLLKHKSEESGYHKQEAERGIVKVPDERLERLTAMFNPKRQINATIEYVKVPGFEGDGKAPRGLPAQFIGNLKNVDAILLVVRDFENEAHPHPFGRIDPAKDMEFINSEFWLSDLALVESRLERLEKNLAKTKDPQNQKELALMKRCKALLDQEKPLRELELTAEENRALRGYQFLTLKPLLYVINIAEDQIPKAAEIEKQLSRFVTPHCALTSLSAEIEREISELRPEDAAVFMADLGITEPALHKLIRSSYELLGLISFFTAGEDECRSWTIRAGTNAQQAAGVIHSDLEKGFIRAETVSYEDFIKHGSFHACKEKGVLRLEGKDYIVKDGDILNIRFNI
ncbi:MAG: redox-regulated ATPase YchF [candidate division KSB1 bacterium]|nr:redox-regulated ATPase YchF [candidate division KSB1 bacterium]MDZ7367781.1 redox-regulated ATPase YchF [candidate division KSB1 bacterium]MDZ7406628.1 redox-regulated ATPase YchF [candidate division KSB1 bacterium]